MRTNVRAALACALLAVVVVAPSAFAETTAATETLHSTSVEWQPQVPFTSAVLTVSGPDGVFLSKGFRAGEALAFSLSEVLDLTDGSYTYELLLAPVIDEATRAALADARAKNDDAAVRHLRKAGKIPPPQHVSGVLTVVNGSIVPRNLVEPGAKRAPVAEGRDGRGASGRAGLGPIKPLDVVVADDLIVQGSACVGLDCVNNESFGFDTIRLKENNTRIKFDDTSTSAGFPLTDWQLTANDSASGGANKFSIEDITHATVPFTITASAPTDSIFVDSTGRLGLRTSTPVMDVHVATGNTPAFRLEQNSSGGFTAQTWDIAGNEANFFVRDVTGGSRLPLRIRPGAPTSSIDIDAAGNVGVGTASPSASLHVSRSDGTAKLLVEETSATTLARTLAELRNDGPVSLHLKDTTVGSPLDYAVTLDGAASKMGIVDATTASATRVGIGTLNPGATLHVAGTLIVDGAVTIGGSVTSAPIQTGSIAPVGFTGSPLRATVTLPVAYANSAYVISLQPISTTGKLVFNVVSKANGSFVVGSDKPVAGLTQLDWLTFHP